MANSFFDFDTSLKGDLDLKNEEPLLPEDDEDGYENEEEYDALNDETFGSCEPSTFDDWEQQHEQFAEFNESSREIEKIENRVAEILLYDSSEDEDNKELLSIIKNPSIWAYTPNKKNGKTVNSSSVLSSLQKASKSFIESHTQNTARPYPKDDVAPIEFSKPAKICTVEELEKSLIQNSQQQPKPPDAHTLTGSVLFQNHVAANVGLQPPQGQQQRPLLPLPPPHMHPYHSMMPHTNARLPPPGLPPMNIPPPNLRHLPPPLNGPHHHHYHPMMPGGFRMMPPHPHFMPPRPPGFGYQLPVAQHHHQHPQHYNFPSLPHNMMPSFGQSQQNISPPKQQQQQQFSPLKQQNLQHANQRVRQDSGNYRNVRDYPDGTRDEYAGLMTSRDKQWLLNIQMIQLNTGTPYFDDYYYTIYKERKSKIYKENAQNSNGRERNGRFENKGRQRRNSERQDGNNLTPRVYTPLQFENSLGKLQCGSVTAPRKIIDMDIVQPEKDQDVPPPSKDSKRTKQYLLELEALYSLLLKAEDIKNPLFISNMEKLREMKQKQRLRELEQAPTAEQKQEVLRLFKLESEPVVENEKDYIVKICVGLLQEDKIASFLNIRKGKMLLLRLLPHLSVEQFQMTLFELWSKVLLSLPMIGRRDTAGDNILPKLYPYFKSYLEFCTISDIFGLISGLMETVKLENSRSTPLGHTGKAPLYFAVLNKFGVSALVAILIRMEEIVSLVDLTERQRSDWSNFLASWAKHSDSVSKVAVPLEAIPSDLFRRHVSRFDQLTGDRQSTLERFYVDVTIIN